MKKLFLILFIAVAAFPSCVNRDNIKINGVESIHPVSASCIEVKLSYENMTRSNIHLNEINLNFGIADSRIGRVMLAEPVLIEKRSTGAVTIPLRVKVDDITAILALSNDMESALQLITVNGHAELKMKGVKKKYKIKDVPLSEIVENFGLDKLNFR